jgi:hypothetical protein
MTQVLVENGNPQLIYFTSDPYLKNRNAKKASQARKVMRDTFPLLAINSSKVKWLALRYSV